MIELGLVGIVDKGTWDASETYNTGNFVLYEGSTYLVTQDGVRNIVPTGESQYYKYLARGVDATDSSDIVVNDLKGIVESAGEDTNVQALFNGIASIAYAGAPTSKEDLVSLAGNIGTGRTFLASVGAGLGASLGLTNTGHNGLLIGRLNGNASTGRVDYVLAGGANFAWGNVACSNKAVTNHNVDTLGSLVRTKAYTFDYSINKNTRRNITASEFGMSVPSGYKAVCTYDFSSGSQYVFAFQANPNASGSAQALSLKNYTTDTDVSSTTARITVLYMRTDFVSN